MFFDGFGRVWRLIMFVCSTVTVFFHRFTASTFPLLPFERPAITFTMSPWRNAVRVGFSLGSLIATNFRSQRDDLGEFLSRSSRPPARKTARPDRLARIVD